VLVDDTAALNGLRINTRKLKKAVEHRVCTVSAGHVAISPIKLSSDPSVNRSRGDIRCVSLNSCAQCLTFQLSAVVHITLNSAYFVRAVLPSCKKINNSPIQSGPFRQNVAFVSVSIKYRKKTNGVIFSNLLNRHLSHLALVSLLQLCLYLYSGILILYVMMEQRSPLNTIQTE
jgi:hypothetical protein